MAGGMSLDQFIPRASRTRSPRAKTICATRSRITFWRSRC